MSEKVREFWIKDHLVLIDADMEIFLKRFSWSIRKSRKTYYAHTNVKIAGKQTSISMHRLICGLPSSEIDHKNRNGLDNRYENLRFCSKAENQRNRIRNNSLFYRGIYRVRNSKFYACQIQLNGKKYRKSGFKSPIEAAKAYDEMSRELHGEFGIRNFEN